jgi:hypothetical protein
VKAGIVIHVNKTGVRLVQNGIWDTEASPVDPDEINHGICPVCYDIQMKEVADLDMPQ